MFFFQFRIEDWRWNTLRQEIYRTAHNLLNMKSRKWIEICKSLSKVNISFECSIIHVKASQNKQIGHSRFLFDIGKQIQRWNVWLSFSNKLFAFSKKVLMVLYDVVGTNQKWPEETWSKSLWKSVASQIPPTSRDKAILTKKTIYHLRKLRFTFTPPFDRVRHPFCHFFYVEHPV